jgi:hypothetical protein
MNIFSWASLSISWNDGITDCTGASQVSPA